MSTHKQAVDEQTGNSHGTVKSYIIGFALSVIITCLAFYIVANEILAPESRIVVLVLLALIQLLVQLVFFLHLNTSSKARWNLVSFIFTLVVVLILVFGSLWIMFSLNYNMMMSH